jgi:hypothetical protein
VWPRRGKTGTSTTIMKRPNRRKPKKLVGAALADHHKRMLTKFFPKKPS